VVGVAEGMRVKLTGSLPIRRAPFRRPSRSLALRPLLRSRRCATFGSRGRRDGEDRPDDTWLSISGRLEKRGRTFVLDAQHVKEVDEPENPYI
jgi:hypothetical protein